MRVLIAHSSCSTYYYYWMFFFILRSLSNPLPLAQAFSPSSPCSRSTRSCSFLVSRVTRTLQSNNNNNNNNKHDVSVRSSFQAFRTLTTARKSSYFHPDNESQNQKNKKGKKQKPKPFTINYKKDPQQAAKLAAAFDELARKEGFGQQSSHFAVHETFEDPFQDPLDMDEDENDEWRGEEGEFLDEDDDDNEEDDDKDILNLDDLDLSDFQVTDNDDDIDDDRSRLESMDPADFNTLSSSGEVLVDSMADRIAAAQRDMDLGRVSVPEDLDRMAQEGGVSPRTLRDLGFRRELNPYGADTTPRTERFKLVTNAMTCSACGSDFQGHDEQRPGYLPPEKFEIQQKLHQIEEMRKLQDKALTAEWSTDDEIDWLIQTQGKGKTTDDGDQESLEDLDLDGMADKLGIDLDALAGKTVICKRCHGLQNFGKIDSSLRPGWSEDPMLAQERFRALLRPIGERPAVIVALVDLFDFAGSVLPELDGIAGDNPVIIAANKADLMPEKMGPVRVENWVRRELEYMGIKSLANIGGAVRLLSCKTGQGVFAMLDKARALAEEMECDIYVVGAANAGKSTLLNFILRKEGEKKDRNSKKKRAGNTNALKGAVTASPLPGTTLKFIKVELDGGLNLYDTPGLLVNGTLTQILTPEELKIVVPKKKIEPLTLRVENGKCVMIGGLARVAIVGDSRPFLLTFFVSNEIKLHATDLSKAEEFRRKHSGGLLTPPLAPGEQRVEELGEFETHVVEIEGESWKEAAADISIMGLGWCAVTGAGKATIEISVPKGVAVSVRPPLMPFDIWDSASKYTGSKAVRKVYGKRKGRSGVGRK